VSLLVLLNESGTWVRLGDTASALDTLNPIAAVVPVADSVIPTETQTILVTLAVTETTAVTDTPSIAAAVPIADSAIAIDTPSIAASIPVTDSTSALDAIPGILATISISETLTATEGILINAAVTVTDSGAILESVSFVVPRDVIDSIGGVDALANIAVSLSVPDVINIAVDGPNPIQATLSLADGVISLDSISVSFGSANILVSDLIAATDGVPTITALLALLESTGVSELPTVAPLIPILELISAAETLAISVTLGLSESIQTTDGVPGLGSAVTLSDLTLSTDAIASIVASLTIADSAQVIELIATSEVAIPKMVSDVIAAGNEVIGMQVTVTLQDTATAADILAAILNVLSIADAVGATDVAIKTDASTDARIRRITFVLKSGEDTFVMKEYSARYIIPPNWR